MRIQILLLILISAICVSAQSASAGVIKIYLPREVNISDELLKLGDIAILRGSAEDTLRASGVTLGKFSVPGQKITINQRTILSMLGANNIASGSVTFSGAKEVRVGRREIVVSAKDIAAKASEFVKENKSDSSIASYEITRSGRKVVLPAQTGEMSLAARLNKKTSGLQAVVDVDVLIDGKKVGGSQVSFRPLYNCRRIIAKNELQAGTMISADNVKVETITSKYPEPKGFKLPVGLVAKRDIKGGQLIRNSFLMKPKPEILIKRNSPVVIKIETPVLSLSVNGKALGQGAFGEMIRVKNIESDRIITCKVNVDGTVSPAI